MAVVLNLGSIEPLGFDGAVSMVRRSHLKLDEKRGTTV